MGQLSLFNLASKQMSQAPDKHIYKYISNIQGQAFVLFIKNISKTDEVIDLGPNDKIK